MHNSAHPFSMILQKIRYTSSCNCFPKIIYSLTQTMIFLIFIFDFITSIV